jgi:hypothetical protein
MTVVELHSGKEHTASGLFHGVFHVADGLLSFALLLLHSALDLQFFITGGLAYALLDVADCFIGYAFDLVRSAAHDLSPGDIGMSSLDTEIDRHEAARVSNYFAQQRAPGLPSPQLDLPVLYVPTISTQNAGWIGQCAEASYL